MADRDSVLDASQIEDATITENELNTSVFGNGLSGGGGTPATVIPDITSTTTTEANAIEVGANGVSVKVDDSTLEGSAQGAGSTETLRIKALGVNTAQIALDAIDATLIEDNAVDSEHYVDGSIDNQHVADDTLLEVKLDATNAPTDGYFLTFDNASGGFTWVESPATSGLQEADAEYDDFSATTNGILTDFTLTDVPVTKTLQVYINGQLVREGIGKGYQLNPDSGDTKNIRVLGDVLATGKKLEAYYFIDN